MLCAVRKFKIFNTNNLWINLRGLFTSIFREILSDIILALKRVMENEGMELEIIVNPKMTDDGHSVVQVFSTHV